MMQHFKNTLSVCLLALVLAVPLAGAHAPVKQAERNGQSLQDFFQQLLSKKAVVGGTVLRGDNDSSSRSNKPLLLANDVVFKVLPGSTSISLAWPSPLSESWEIVVAGRAVKVQGGVAKVALPELAAKGLHSWELRDQASNKAQLAGHWFFIQNIEAAEGIHLLELVKQARGDSMGQAPGMDAGVQKVCEWMWNEQLVEFNDWCVQMPDMAAREQ